MRSFPSAVRRIRLQSEQNGWETGSMKPSRPGAPSANRYVRAVALGSRSSSTSGKCSPIRVRISSPLSTLSGVHPSSASSGMNSMKRTSKGCSRAKRANGRSSCSVKPRKATALTLIRPTPGCAASVCRPSRTRGRASRRVISKKRSRCSESIETLKRFTPAATRAAASRSSR